MAADTNGLMKTAKIAVIVGEDSPSAVHSLRSVLEFLGIPCQLCRSPSHLVESARNGAFSTLQYCVIGSLQAVHDLVLHSQATTHAEVLGNVHSVFAYLPEDTTRSTQLLQALAGNGNLELARIEGGGVRAKVSSDWPELTGPMHGVETSETARPPERVLKMKRPDTVRSLISVGEHAAFFSLQSGRLQLFVSCSSKIANVEDPLNGSFYDINDQFFSAVPVLMYLKWAFRDTCWQANETGACLIIDDPVLKTRYGFCDFQELDRLMQKHSFTTNVAFIPWNWRRTSPDMAALIRNSGGRLSISVHGCDHTGAEFGTSALETLHAKTAIAKLRMERHRARTSIPHELVMVFPQGVFSRASLKVLQHHQFLAAVNTELFPAAPDEAQLTIGDIWSVAINKYGSFPFFVRRYPAHGLANFAFDLLLGKPCLIVEHHEFFKEAGRNVTKFARALNSLNCNLKWRGLGDVLRRSHHWRKGVDGAFYIRMFANEIVLANDSGERRTYCVEKADRGSVGVENILTNDVPVELQRRNGSVIFRWELDAGAELSFRVQYRGASEQIRSRYDFRTGATTAVRRYLSEFRDNVLSRHVGLLQGAQKVRSFLAGR